MARKCEVEQHPERQRIVRALARGDSYRIIMERYGITKASLSRFMTSRLLPRAAKEKAERELRDGKGVLDEINRIMVRVNKMFDACDEYLSDPNREGKYWLGPRAEEVEIVYMDDSENGGVMKRDKLDVILANKGKGRAVSVHYRHADPRKLILDTAKVLTIQLELLARISGEIKDVTINIINTPVWIRLQQIILDATKDKPEVRKKIADALHIIEEPSRGA